MMKALVPILGLVLILSCSAQASMVRIYVSDGKVKDCPPKTIEPEELRYVLKPKDAAAALKRYVAGQRNPEQYDAAFVNAGLRFCSPASALIVFKQLTESLKPADPPQKVWELVRNYRADPSLLEALDARLKEKKLPAPFQQNLVQARGMTVPKDFDRKKIKYH